MSRSSRIRRSCGRGTTRSSNAPSSLRSTRSRRSHRRRPRSLRIRTTGTDCRGSPGTLELEMHPPLRHAVVTAVSITAAACHGSSSTPSPLTEPEAGHHQELHLPPVGPTVRVTLDGKSADVALADIPHEVHSVQLVQVWK